MKVSKKVLDSLREEIKWGNHVLGDYRILRKEKVTKEVHHPIPYRSYSDVGFAEYLRGFEEYYTMGYQTKYTTEWILKPEFRKNRPNYAYTVTYTEYDIELTEDGRATVEGRYKMHRRLMERYARLLG